jgi:hypothetical protein
MTGGCKAPLGGLELGEVSSTINIVYSSLNYSLEVWPEPHEHVN